MHGYVSGSGDGAHLGNGVIHTGLDVVQTLQADAGRHGSAALDCVWIIHYDGCHRLHRSDAALRQTCQW